MADESFLRRWSRLKTTAPSGTDANVRPAPPSDAVDAGLAIPPAGRVGDAEVSRAIPTLDDVAALTADSDFSAFVGRGVDADVRRSALRKLFADPHFNRMDGLDVYIGDYTQASPLPATMLAALDHARNLFGPADPTPEDAVATLAAPPLATDESQVPVTPAVATEAADPPSTSA